MSAKVGRLPGFPNDADVGALPAGAINRKEGFFFRVDSADGRFLGQAPGSGTDSADVSDMLVAALRRGFRDTRDVEFFHSVSERRRAYWFG